MTDVCSHGRPDHQEWLSELYEAVYGDQAPATPVTPQQMFAGLLEEIRRRGWSPPSQSDMEDLAGRVWDQWGSLSERDKRRIRRRHPLLAAALEGTEMEYRQEVIARWKTLLGTRR